MNVVDIVQQHLGPNEIQQIGQQLGVDPATAQQAVESAVPSIVAGMAGHAQEPQGASAIGGLLGSYGGILGSLGSILGGAASGDGGILGQILGRHTDTVGQEVQQTSGLDADKTRKLLMILAPIVLAALARRQQQSQQTTQGTSPAPQAGLDQVLKQDAQAAQSKSPGMGGLLGKILNQVETSR
jgi:hypothetical protein